MARRRIYPREWEGGAESIMDIAPAHRSTMDRWKDLADRPFFVPMVAFDVVVLAVVQELPGMSCEVRLPTHSPPLILDILDETATAVRLAVSNPRQRNTAHALENLLARECPHPDVGVPLPGLWKHIAIYLLAFSLTPRSRLKAAPDRKVAAKIWDGVLVIIPPAQLEDNGGCPSVWADMFVISEDEFRILFEINNCLLYSTYGQTTTQDGTMGKRLFLGPMAISLASCREHGGEVVQTPDMPAGRWTLRLPGHMRTGGDHPPHYTRGRLGSLPLLLKNTCWISHKQGPHPVCANSPFGICWTHSPLQMHSRRTICAQPRGVGLGCHAG